MHIFDFIIMLWDFHNTKLDTTQVGEEIKKYGYNCTGIKMAGNTYWLNMTLCWVHKLYMQDGQLCI